DVRELSYGTRRMVEVARALASEPRMLVLDEPAAGLSGADVQTLARAIRAEVVSDGGPTVLIIEHNLELMMELCDRITVIDRGAVIADDRPESVRTNPRVVTAYLG